jgi:hypothetical protein
MGDATISRVRLRDLTRLGRSRSSYGAWLATLAVDTVFIAFYAFAPFVRYRRLTA